MSAGRGEAKAFLNAAISFDSEDCLIWPFAKNDAGYGQIRLGGKTVYVHRLICGEAYGPPNDGQDAAHSCGNGHLGCINKRHLRWATRAQNIHDTIAHGTAHRGERHNAAKLSRDSVIAIRNLKGKQTLAVTADQFGISISQVSGVQNLKTWRWL